MQIFEDPEFAVVPANRATWLGQWHSEREWFQAIHKTRYSNALIGLDEVINIHPIPALSDETISSDDALIRRFRVRQRRLTDVDMLIMASDHWNFDVRGFNPGGNHGSFFRTSTNSVFMIAGGSQSSIPRGLAVDEPYDGLSVVPTLLTLMGKTDANGIPSEVLKSKGFKRFPGPVVTELIDKQNRSSSAVSSR